METIVLSKKFKLQNGTEVTELKLNFDELSVGDFRQIKKLESQISDTVTVDVRDMARPKSLSFEFQLASGFLAAVKGTDGLQISDFSKLPMVDSLALAQYANFFWLNVD